MTKHQTTGFIDDDDFGPAYHPDNPEYVKRWHTHRGDVEGEDGLWRDATGAVIDHLDFPPKKAAKK